MAAPQRPLASSPSLEAAMGVADRLRETFATGRTRSAQWRREQLGRLKAMMEENAERFIEALRLDLGKPELEAWATEISIVVGEATGALKSLDRWMRPERVTTPLVQQPASARIIREPLGVVLIISPWNYPVQLLLSPLVGAIAAGNCVVLKPSEVTPRVSALLAELCSRYLDADAIATIEGGVEETTELLRQRFDHIFYTGNGAVARIVMRAAAENLTPVTLELGGKSPCIVTNDADIGVAARRIAWGKFMNAGQTCIAPDYILVQEERQEELIEALRRTVHEFYGDDPKATPDYARIVNERHHRRLTKLLEGADVAVGGQADESQRYIAPTILRNVKPSDPVMKDEIFGPILPVLPIHDVDSAIRFVNEREKPLALYVFTGSDDTAERVIGSTSSGGACINATIWHIANPNLPFGGVGPSGMGGYHGHHSFEVFSHRKSVVSKMTRVDPPLVYPPYTSLKKTLVKTFA